MFKEGGTGGKAGARPAIYPLGFFRQKQPGCRSGRHHAAPSSHQSHRAVSDGSLMFGPTGNGRCARLVVRAKETKAI